MARSEARVRLLAACLAALITDAARADGLYLYVIPTSAAPGFAPAGDAPLRVAAYADDPAGLARRLGAPEPAAGAAYAELALGEYPQLPAPPGLADDAPSFVIDYDEAPVAALRSELVAKHGEQPSRAQLVEFVDAAIRDKKAPRGFALASRVARDRAGDCTEHAVLLTALARSVGLRARVALGLAIVLDENGVQSYGHAWAELRERDRWVVADAALNDPALRVHHLPFGVLGDEGPGFALALAQLTPVWVKRVEILGTPAAPE